MTQSSEGRVLAVDDREEFAELLATDLEGQGYEVETANRGEECLEKAVRFQPDVILLDVKMPGMDGFTTCFALKADPRTRNIPVVFLTGHNAEEGSAVAAIAAGGADFLEKPYSPVILLSRVAAHLASYRRLRSFVDTALIDPDTGAFTRAALLDAGNREIARALRAGSGALALARAQLDGLPDHAQASARSEALIEAAKVVQSAVGAADMVAIEDDSLWVLMPGLTPSDAKDQLEDACKRARDAGHPLSAGLVGYDAPAAGASDERLASLMSASRAQAERARDEGGDRLCVG